MSLKMPLNSDPAMLVVGAAIAQGLHPPRTIRPDEPKLTVDRLSSCKATDKCCQSFLILRMDVREETLRSQLFIFIKAEHLPAVVGRPELAVLWIEMPKADVCQLCGKRHPILSFLERGLSPSTASTVDQEGNKKRRLNGDHRQRCDDEIRVFFPYGLLVEENDCPGRQVLLGQTPALHFSCVDPERRIGIDAVGDGVRISG